MEPSTRTTSSFQAAMNRLGGNSILVNAQTSSFVKGETLEDTVRVMQNYVDVIAIRHPTTGSVANAAAVSSVPILNAGDGPGEHPTQALLDAFCMQQELGKLDGLTVTFVGDLKYGRTVHSLSRTLAHFKVKINYISPPELVMPEYIIEGTPGEHPTQALLDAFCMQQELGKLDGLTVTFVGDLKYGRTVHSLSRTLAHFKVKINYISPPELVMPEYIIEELKAKGVEQHVGNDLEKVMPQTDVLYVTRIQQERFPNKEDYLKLKGSFVVGPDTVKNAKKKMIVMHPLPRVDELLPSLDSDPRAVYFKQPGYGMHTRMALLAMVLGKR
eukprot:TRINITY_DN534_c0_g1_i1.p1 TRINITY_DN534_c0_g1~~TRINITY_DN534_c0_g1_i1.p1  ORF type:complete len:328 (-),score=82.83 TRINITY_DN534_c0_g1_i1:1030-2013(-)